MRESEWIDVPEAYEVLVDDLFHRQDRARLNIIYRDEYLEFSIGHEGLTGRETVVFLSLLNNDIGDYPAFRRRMFTPANWQVVSCVIPC